MGSSFSRGIVGASAVVTVLAATAQTLAQMGGGFLINDNAGQIDMAFDGDLADVKIIARFTVDGTTPTAAIGRPLFSFNVPKLSPDQAKTFKFIAVGADITARVDQFEFEQAKA